MLREQGSKQSIRIKPFSEQVTAKSPLFSVSSLIFSGIASFTYLLVSYFLIGFRTDQLILVGIFNACYFLSYTTRHFILGFSIFIVYWIIFDYMKAFPNYKFNTVHIESLYQAEKSLFGIPWGNVVLTPNEYFALHTSKAADIITGFFYLCWVPVPLGFAGFLFFKNRQAFFQFSLTFFLVNLIGFIGYYSYPAAPPWYVLNYGFEFNPATPGNTAGFSRFDEYLNVSVFQNMYAKSSNVFAAMPSMHAAFVMIVLFFGIKHKYGAWNVFFAIVMIGIWFGAVYSGHHYILDVLAGILCAAVAIALLQWWMHQKSGKNFMRFLLKHTT